jgi:universal stress protein G
MYKKILMPVDVFEMDLSDKAVRHAATSRRPRARRLPWSIFCRQQPVLLRGFNADIKKFEEYMTEESGKKMNALKGCSISRRRILTAWCVWQRPR